MPDLGTWTIVRLASINLKQITDRKKTDLIALLVKMQSGWRGLEKEHKEDQRATKMSLGLGCLPLKRKAQRATFDQP